MNNLYIITGGMGAGKTTTINRLNEHFNTVIEPARSILAEQRSIVGSGVPELDPNLFTHLMLSRMIYQYELSYKKNDFVIFDRGIPDIVAYAKIFNLETDVFYRAAKKYKYSKTVFLMKPKKEIYCNDAERKMSFYESTQFTDLLVDIYQSLGYIVIDIPLMAVDERASHIRQYMFENM